MKKNNYWIIAGMLNLFTALLHTIGGQLSLVDPLLQSNLTDQVKAEWFGAWHMVTIVLFATSFYLLQKGFAKGKDNHGEIIKPIGILYSLFAIPSIVSSIMMQVFAPQWIILLPIGIFALVGMMKNKKTTLA